MRVVATLVLLGAVAACGRKAAREGAPVAPPPDGGALDARPAPIPPDATPAVDGAVVGAVVGAAPPLDPTLVTLGPAVRLASRPVRTRKIAGAAVPVVALTNRKAQAAIDAALAAAARDGSACRVMLATDELVTMRCLVDDGMSAGTLADDDALHLAIAGATVTPIEPSALFHPGTDLPRVLAASVGDATPAGGRLVIGALGVVEHRAGDGVDVVYPWRALAPHVRADGPLGPALVAAGLPLAPPGTAALPLPPATIALAPHARGEAIAAWWRLDDAGRGAVRLLAPAGDDFGPRLLFPPGTDRGAAAAVGAGAPIVDAVLVAAAATLALARTSEATELRAAIGTRAPIVRLVPRGAIVAAAAGAIDGTASQLGRGWALAGLASGDAGWVPGRVVASTSCAPAAPADVPATLTGTGALTIADAVTPVAWFAGAALGGGGGTAIAIHALAGCVVGAQVRRLVVAGELRDLWFVRADGDRGPALIVVVTAPVANAPARTVTVFGDGDAPVFQRALERGEVTGPDPRGPAGRAGYYPVVLDGRAWLRWDGATLSDQPAAP
ncbi:MAG: hypothetical protein IPL61_37435 [Myxococcales bacterium]|nr:hypothetical protein [Myxococcales bacterium]